MSLHTTLIARTLACVLTIAALGGFSYWSNQQQVGALQNAGAIATVTQRQLQADMLRSAVTADTLRAEQAASEKDSDQWEEIRTALASHALALRQTTAENAASTLPSDITQLYRGILPQTEIFVAAANVLVTALESGEDAAGARRTFANQSAMLDASSAAMGEHLLAWARSANAQADEAALTAGQVILALGIVAVLCILTLPVQIDRLVLRPQRRLIRALGEDNARIPGVTRTDDVGVLARAIQQLKTHADDQAQRASAAQAERERRARRDRLTAQFIARIQETIGQVAKAASALNRHAETMNERVAQASTRVSDAVTSSTEASRSMEQAMAAAGALSAAMHTIAGQLATSHGDAQDAIGQVNKLDASILDEATRQIGQLVEVVQSIASQTNLLALNAVIESARAGEAGTGFAAVAGEVKTLAGQTRKAGDDMAANITNIQQVTMQIMASLRAVKAAMERVEEASSAIAKAVAQQSAATTTLAEQPRLTELQDGMRQARVATAESRDAAGQVRDAAQALAKDADRLTKEVSSFLAEMAA